MIYYLIFIILIFLSLAIKERSLINSAIIFFVLLVFIGLRHEVGADWDVYLNHFNYDPSTFLDRPGYFLIISISNFLGWSIYGTNLLGAVIFLFGLIYFCNNQKNPSMALISSYPYLIVVVGMGFLNQSCALGLEMIGLTFFQKKNLKAFLFMIFLASLFHNTAIVLFSIPIMDNILNFKNRKSLTLLIFTLIAIGLFSITYLSNLREEYKYFFEAEYAALGALFKIFVPVFFALIFLFRKKMFEFSEQTNKLCMAMSINIFLICIYTFFGVTTAGAYRLSIYFYPLIFIITSGICSSYILNIPKKDWKLIFIALNFLLLLIWFNFSYHSNYWLPYQNFLLF